VCVHPDCQGCIHLFSNGCWDHLTEWLCDNLRFLRIIEEDILTVTVFSITNARSWLDA